MALALTRYLAASALLWLSAFAEAGAADIAWYSADIPPLYIFGGGQEGAGYGDMILNLVAGGPPKRVTISRTWYEIEHHPVSCTTGALKTSAREAIALFSARPALVPNYMLITRADLAARFAPYMTGEGRLDLAKLVQQNDMTGGFIASRVYPGILGDMLTSQRPWHMERLNETPLLVNLLRSNRISFFFLSPVELAYYRQTNGGEDRWVGVAINGMPSHVETYTAFSRTPEGQKVIAQVDDFFAHDEEWTKVTSVLASWESRAKLENFSDAYGR
jgi:uncharacterized protein (TIGR02285 family)